MKRMFRVLLFLCLMMTIFAGCASQPTFHPLRPDPQNLEQGRIGDYLVSLLRAAGRDAMGCSLFFFESKNLGAIPAGQCMFGVTTSLAATRDDRLLRGALAEAVAIQVLGYADQIKTTTEAIVAVGQLGLPGAMAALAISLFTAQGLLTSERDDAKKKATEILAHAGDPDPGGTLQYAFGQLQTIGIVEPWPDGKRPDFWQRKVNMAVMPLMPGLERPTYTLSQKWSRNDGEYKLTRMDGDVYVFSAGPEQEIHLNKDLMVCQAKRGGWITEFESLPEVWPPVVGKWGTEYGRWRVPSEPTAALVRYEWSIDTYEEIRVPAGTFKAFRIVMTWEPLEARASFGRKRLVSWYAPAVRQLLKAEFTDAGPLSFQVIAVDGPGTLVPK